MLPRIDYSRKMFEYTKLNPCTIALILSLNKWHTTMLIAHTPFVPFVLYSAAYYNNATTTTLHFC